mgnify:CR=1 FL=1
MGKVALVSNLKTQNNNNMKVMIINNDNLKRRLVFAFLFLVGFCTLALAHSTDDESRLTREEAYQLIELVKKELKVESYEPTFVFDEETGILEELSPLKIIKIYDCNDELLLEAPIAKLRQAQNKHLRKLLNASDFLTSFSNTSYYRLDLK